MLAGELIRIAVDSGEDWYDMEGIIKYRPSKHDEQTKQFLTKWKGYGD